MNGTFRLGGPNQRVQAYLLQEAAHKERAATDIRLAALSLRQLRCPGELIRRTDRAAEEDLFHAQALARCAHQVHAPVPPPHEDLALTDLVGFALETATERCVADTYAAARFAYQARRAASPELRSVFHDIARDDALHTALFWELLDWALSQLSPARARSIAVEQKLVREALRVAVQTPLPEEIYFQAGVPDAAAGHALMDALEFELWSEIAA